MELEGPDEQTRRQRELRRKKILENAKSRMEKLKKLQQKGSSSRTETDVPEESLESVVPQNLPEQLFEDPPDEIIERVPHPSTQCSNDDTTSTGQFVSKPSLLCYIVATIRSNCAFKARTVFAFLCSLSLTILTWMYDYSFSYLSTMFLMELSLLLTIVLVAKSGSSGNSMKGDWILQMKGLLAFLHPLLPDVFEICYLCLYIFLIMLRDLITMIFGLIVFMSIANIV